MVFFHVILWNLHCPMHLRDSPMNMMIRSSFTMRICSSFKNVSTVIIGILQRLCIFQSFGWCFFLTLWQAQGDGGLVIGSQSDVGGSGIDIFNYSKKYNLIKNTCIYNGQFDQILFWHKYTNKCLWIEAYSKEEGLLIFN